MYWCDKCEDTTPAWYQADRKPVCCICKNAVIECGEYIRILRDNMVDLRDACSQKQEAIDANDGLTADYLEMQQQLKTVTEKLNEPVFGGKPFPVITVEMLIEHSQAKAFEIGILEAQIIELKRWRDEMDTQLVIHHIGTVDSEPDPKVAHVKLQEWCYNHGKYDQQQPELKKSSRVGWDKAAWLDDDA